MNLSVTIFQDLNNTSVPYHKDVLEVLDRIKTGKKSKDPVTQVRNSTNTEIIDEIKKSIPVICFSGEIYKISEDAINSHSGLICLDFSGYKSEAEVNEDKELFSQDDYVFSCFKSIRGLGLKVIVKIPADISTHKACFNSLRGYFSSDRFNPDSSDISSVCYESYDPNIYINQDSLEWAHFEDSVEEEVIEGPQNVKEAQPETVRRFWTVSDKGVVKLDQYGFMEFLVDNGFFKYYPGDSKNFVFVRRISNRVVNVTEQYIKDFILKYVDDKIDSRNVWNFFADKTRYFKEDYLSFLPAIDIKFVRDTSNTSYLFYRNVAVKVTKTKIEKIEYDDLDGWVWEDQMINRDYASSKMDNCDFKTFIHNISNNKEDRIKSIQSAIGYLLHGFKDKSECPAVILNDEVISDNPEGGTGKGLFAQGVSQLRKMIDIDGKRFKMDSSFAYQRVQQDTQILTFDDVKPNFDFESLFSLITEGITLEKKNKDAIKIPFEDSPKVLITTNYAIMGSGNSFERRKFELEFKQHYNKDFTPLDEFNRRLFDEWDDKEWRAFDNYMLSNIQFYLNNGLVEGALGNLGTRKFIASTSKEFYEWIDEDGNLFNRLGYKFHLKNSYEEFVEIYPDYARTGKMSISRQLFSKWLDSYGKYKYGRTPASDKDSNGKWFVYERKENEQLKADL